MTNKITEQVNKVRNNKRVIVFIAGLIFVIWVLAQGAAS
jgi:hypothetical protein